MHEHPPFIHLTCQSVSVLGGGGGRVFEDGRPMFTPDRSNRASPEQGFVQCSEQVIILYIFICSRTLTNS